MMYRSFGFGRSLPQTVKFLLIINVAVFVATTILSFNVRYLNGIRNGWYILFGLVPYLVNNKFMIWQFFTYMFLHGSLSHILFNMFALWMFGVELEYNWGKKDFLKYYFACGIGGGILVWFTSMVGFSGSYYAPTIGASGAIFGILVAFGMMWPDRLIFLFGVMPIKALHFVLIFGAIDLWQGLSGTAGNIAVFAHIGGGVSGFIYLKYGWRIMIHIEHMINKYKARKFTVIRGGRESKYSSGNSTGHPDIEDEVDRILDKIAREGMDSLSDSEKRILERASGKKAKG